MSREEDDDLSEQKHIVPGGRRGPEDQQAQGLYTRYIIVVCVHCQWKHGAYERIHVLRSSSGYRVSE